MKKYFFISFVMMLWLICMIMVISSEQANAGSYNGDDLARSILANESTLIDSDYWDRDRYGTRQSIILESKGTMSPTEGSDFVILSTGIAGTDIATTDEDNPGNERGTWFRNRYGNPRDKAVLTLELQVPAYMHYLYYDFQFYSTEYPEYVGTSYNDKFKVKVTSPSQGISSYICDVNSGNFVLDSNYISGTGFDVFAQSGNPGNVDIVDLIQRIPGADAGATALVTMGGETHPVSPNEIITVQFSIKDVGDNQFDSAVFIDNLKFAGEAFTEVLARKSVEDTNGGVCEEEDNLEYRIIISNTGDAAQNNNPGNEYEDSIPEYATFVAGSATASSGTIEYDSQNNMVIWNGEIPDQSSIILEYSVQVNQSVANGTIISSQGNVLWDSDENGDNDALELTDDTSIDDGIDQDGDGETNDDDPTNITVIAFEVPDSVSEGFSGDTAGQNATQYYSDRLWFETSDASYESTFEVAGTYHYSTSKSFKTKIRQDSGSIAWNYTLSNLESDISWWEIYFTCGNTSEGADVILTFKDTSEEEITKIKIEYVQQGTDYLTDWVAEFKYYHPTLGWRKLNSNYSGGYLYNGWYKIKIERNDISSVNFYLYQNDDLADTATCGILSASFSNLEKVLWSSTKNPVICPLFFWDEHSIGLTI